MTLNRCTLTGCLGYLGGAIYNAPGMSMSLTQCTLCDNYGVGGGAIFNSGTMTLTHCTVSGNRSASNPGGGIQNLGSLTIINSIVADNVSPGGDIDTSGTLIREGVNLVTAFLGSGTVIGSGSILASPPLLSAPGNYGGLTPTMVPHLGSPARNNATGSVITSDQRGFPIVGVPDIGAYETGTPGNCAAYLAESLPFTTPAALLLPSADFDADGATNEQEWNARTDPASAASVLRIFSVTHTGADLNIAFKMVFGRNYTLWYSDSLTGGWTDAGFNMVGANGAVGFFEVPAPVAGVPKRFYRVQAGP